MIGLYIQDEYIQRELCQLFKDEDVQPYNPKQKYDSVIWLSSRPIPTDVPVFTAKDLDLPLSLSEWHQFLYQSRTSMIYYQNKTFAFDANQRWLLRLKDGEKILLTEKESALLAFLCQAPSHMASRDSILQSVWKYSPQAETHTLESHLYSLKQKLNGQSELLIQIQNDIIKLI